MLTEFHFSGFSPDEALKERANQMLDQIIERAPYGAMPVAMLKEEGGLYHCLVEIYSQHGPFIANATQVSPLVAIQHVEEILSNKIEKWLKSRRFGDRLTA